jgi:hypothetical protein
MGHYQVLAKTIGRITPSEERNRLKAIKICTQKLLLEFGVNPNNATGRIVQGRLSDRPSWEQLRLLNKENARGLNVALQLAFAGIETTDKDMTIVNAELRKASTQVADAVIGLLKLHQRAKAAMQVMTKRIAPGRGGSRHRPTAKGRLLRDAITIYAHMREQYPDSGNKFGYGGPMLRFVHAAAALYGTHVRDAEIRDACRARKSKRK